MIKKKIITLPKLLKIVKALKKRSKRIVFTNGCFDIMHLGHIKYLEKSKSYGEILIIGVNSDKSVKRLKGKTRPINSLKVRLGCLAALECVDFVISFNDATPIQLIKAIKPNILTKGGDWKKELIVGAEEVLSRKGRVISIPLLKGYSTTQIIKKIKSEKRNP